MDVKLRVVGGKNAGQEITVPAPRFVIGRAADCHLRAKSDAIGERHCELEVGEGFVRIRDLGSATGTLVNLQRVSGQQELKIGDKLRVGPLEFELVLNAALSGKKKPKVQSIEEAAQRLAGEKKPSMAVDDWLSDGDDDANAPSRNAANFTIEEQIALGMIEGDATPVAAENESSEASDEPKKKPIDTSVEDTKRAAAEMINKLNKYNVKRR